MLNNCPKYANEASKCLYWQVETSSMHRYHIRKIFWAALSIIVSNCVIKLANLGVRKL